MKSRPTLIYLALSICLLLSSACSSGGGSSPTQTPSPDATPSSSSSSSSGESSTQGSHRAGQNCMASGCHDGNAASRFTVGGTVYRNNGQVNTNAEIYLYIHNTNTISTTLQTDASGNFFTSEAVQGLADGSGQLVTGVDVEVHGNNGIATMPGLITSGQCNGCHGVSNGRITVN